MNKYALLLRMNLDHWARWHSQLAIYGHADVWFTTNRLHAMDIGPGIPVVVLDTEGRGFTAWGKTTGTVREGSDWLTAPPEHRAQGKGPKTRVYVRLHRACVPLSALQERPSLANLHQTTHETTTWLTEEQYLDFCQIRGIKRKEPSTPRPIPLPKKPVPDPDPRDAVVAQETDFETILATLSVRAGNILRNRLVKDVASFLSLTDRELLICRNCGKKTLAEIVAVQDNLRSASAQTATASPCASISFDAISPTVFDAIRSNLDVRANHALERLSVHDLAAFMRLDQVSLLTLRNCGRKTAKVIHRFQKSITEFAQSQAVKDGVFRPEELLAAPCLTGNTPTPEELNHPEGVFPDPENPALWLIRWVQGLVRSERQTRAFMLRMGMLGVPPMTLEAVAEHVGGVTRERARQMQRLVEKKAETSYQQLRLRPLVDVAAAVVDQKGGLVSLDELTMAVLCRGKDGEQLRHATGLMAFFSTLQVWKDAGLRLRKDKTVCNASRQDEEIISEKIVGRSSTHVLLRFPPPPRAKEEQLHLDFNELKI